LGGWGGATGEEGGNLQGGEGTRREKSTSRGSCEEKKNGRNDEKKRHRTEGIPEKNATQDSNALWKCKGAPICTRGKSPPRSARERGQLTKR